MRTIVVVPCYNEEHRLPVQAFRDFAGDGVEFLFVNDGSRDGTLKLIQSMQEENPSRFAAMSLDRNRGKAEAVRQGILAAMDRKPDFTGFWDADLATPLDEMPSFLRIFATRPEIEMVMGARVRLLGRRISRRPARHYFGRVGATLISSSLGLAVYDTQCGAKLFRVSDSMRELFSRTFISKWIFDVEIIARLVQARGRDATARAIYELPITQWHDVKGSKVKSTDFLRALNDLRKIHRAYKR